MLQFLREIDELPKERECLKDNEWLNNLAFLVDITNHFNVLHTILQSSDTLFTDKCEYITAFKIKLQLFAGHLLAKRFEHFEHLKERSLQLRQLADASVDTDEYAENLKLCK